jgi:hypothetical protein
VQTRMGSALLSEILKGARRGIRAPFRDCALSANPNHVKKNIVEIGEYKAIK